MFSCRSRPFGLIASLVFLILFSTMFFRIGYHREAYDTMLDISHNLQNKVDSAAPTPLVLALPKPPIYKKTGGNPPRDIVDNFPLASFFHHNSDRLSISPWNRPPVPHVSEQTPLLIGFTRNWRLLQQVVVSYITAGWPPEDIYVIENTGVMQSNQQGLLSLQNPFFLNHTRLRLLGVNVVETPTLFTFAQLQNFYVSVALRENWSTYWWGHMDAVVISDEASLPFKSLYTNAVDVLREASSPDFARHAETNNPGHWAVIFHAYDQLALVQTKVYVDVGAWDVQIPFYMTDCDFHARLMMAGYPLITRVLGKVFDVANTFDDLAVFYREKSGPTPSFSDLETGQKVMPQSVEVSNLVLPGHKQSYPVSQSLSIDKMPRDMITASEASNSQEGLNSTSYTELVQMAELLMNGKHGSSRGRNTWQSRQTGGQGDPFYRDPRGFERGIEMTMELGRQVFREKWGHLECDIWEAGYRAGDAWRVEHDWEPVVPNQST